MGGQVLRRGFGRPFPEPLPRWDDETARGADFWATEQETRDEIIGFYRRAWEHSDATISALPIDAPGHVPWWPRPNVKLFNIMVHILSETSRHAGHADILLERFDGAIGADPESTASATYDAAYWKEPLLENRAGRQSCTPSFRPGCVASAGVVRLARGHRPGCRAGAGRTAQRRLPEMGNRAGEALRSKAIRRADGSWSPAFPGCEEGASGASVSAEIAGKCRGRGFHE